MLDEFDIRPLSGPNDVRIRKHTKVTDELDSVCAADIWRYVVGHSPTFTHKYKRDRHGGSRVDTFALTPEVTDLVIPKCMEHLLG